VSPDLLSTALNAVERGWYVFPLRPDAKVPAVRRWEQRATTEPARIIRCWTAGPYGVGVACGPSGLCVIDLDVPKANTAPPPGWHGGTARHGADVLAALAADAGQPVPGDDGTYQVVTGSGGRHLYYAVPDGAELRNTAGERGRGLGWLIDTRAAGGYVVAAGSTVAGRPYTVAVDGPVRELPAWLADRLTAPPAPPAPASPVRLDTSRHSAYLARAIRSQVDYVANEPDHHNDALYRSACALGQLVAGGALGAAEVRTALMDAYARHIAAEPDKHNEREAHNTITSGFKAGAKRPRKVAA
jgi:hypothetical protein